MSENNIPFEPIDEEFDAAALKDETAEAFDRAYDAAGETAEEVKVAGRDFIKTLQSLLREAAVRKITVKDKTGRTLLEFPLYAGVIGTFVIGSWTVVALIAAWFAEVSILIERDLASDGDHRPAFSGDLADSVRSKAHDAADSVRTRTGDSPVASAGAAVTAVIGSAARSAGDLAKRAADALEERLHEAGQAAEAAADEAAGAVEEAAATAEEKAIELRQCLALTKSGARCKRNALVGTDYCSTHQPLAN